MGIISWLLGDNPRGSQLVTHQPIEVHTPGGGIDDDPNAGYVMHRSAPKPPRRTPPQEPLGPYTSPVCLAARHMLLTGYTGACDADRPPDEVRLASLAWQETRDAQPDYAAKGRQGAEDARKAAAYRETVRAELAEHTPIPAPEVFTNQRGQKIPADVLARLGGGR